MLKKLLIPVALLLVLALALPAFAATDQSNLADQIAAIQQQIKELQSQLVDLYASQGQISQEQAEQWKDNLNNAPQNGYGPGFGPMWGGGQSCPMWGGGWNNSTPSQSGYGYGRGFGMMSGFGRPF